MINGPRASLRWTDPPAVATVLDFGPKCLLKKGKAWSGGWHDHPRWAKGRDVQREFQGTLPSGSGVSTFIPHRMHAWWQSCKNMSVSFGWQPAKIGGYQNAPTGEGLGWRIHFHEWKSLVQWPQGEETWPRALLGYNFHTNDEVQLHTHSSGPLDIHCHPHKVLPTAWVHDTLWCHWMDLC